MLTVLDILVLILCTRTAIAGPFLRYRNATVTTATSTSGPEGSNGPSGGVEYSYDPLSYGTTSSTGISGSGSTAPALSHVSTGTSNGQPGTTTLTLWTTVPSLVRPTSTDSIGSSDGTSENASSNSTPNATAIVPNVPAIVPSGPAGAHPTTTMQTQLSSDNGPSTGVSTASTQPLVPENITTSTVNSYDPASTLATTGPPTQQRPSPSTASPKNAPSTQQTGIPGTNGPYPFVFPTPTTQTSELSTQSPPSSSSNDVTSSSSSYTVPIISIIPINPSMTTVTVTVSVPSWTTTVAEKTITIGAGEGQYRGGW